MESQLYQAHPVFEFLITVYIAIILAPKYLDDYFESSTSLEIIINHQSRFESRFEALQEEVTKDCNIFQRILDPLVNEINPANRFYIQASITDLQTQDAIVQTKIDDLRKANVNAIFKEITPFVRKRYQPLFILTVFMFL